MKKIKILFALLAVVALLACSLNVFLGVFAEDHAQIIVSSVEAERSSEVTVSVSLANNPGICAMVLSINYDSDLELVDAKDAGLLNGPTLGNNYKTNPYTATWEDSAAASDNSQNGIILNLKFKVKDTAGVGLHPVSVSYSTDPSDMEIYNLALDFVSFDCVSGGVTVVCNAHVPAAAVQENVLPATCGATGSYDEVVYCSVCGAEISRTPKTIDATGNHTPGEPVNENVVPATCGQNGSHDEVVYCTVCNTEISRATKTDLATGEHDFVWMSNAEAHWQQCKNCPAMPEGAESEAHTFEYKVTKEATTKAPGEKVPTCTKCGYEGKAEEIPQLEDLSVEDGDQALDIKENNAVVFKTNIKKDRFSGIKIDGIELEDEDYELGEDESGNTVLTLTDAGKAKLAAKNGDVAVQILGTDEDGNPAAAEYTLTVTNTQPSATDDTNTETGTKTDAGAKTDDTKAAPKTDDSDIAFLVIALVALMGMSISTGIVYRKKRNNK